MSPPTEVYYRGEGHQHPLVGVAKKIPLFLAALTALRCGLAALRSYVALHTACTITSPELGVSCPELAALAPALA